MAALSYLFFKKLKNQFREFIRQPSKLIFAVILLACIAVTLAPSQMGGSEYKTYRSMEEFYAIVAALYAVVFVMSAKSGFNNGASIFSMADVNLLFVSPIKGSRILFFGMLQQLGKSLYLGAFLLFQYTLANEYYGIDYTTLIIVAVGYGLTALFSQMVSTLIYIAVGSSDRKTLIGKGIFYSVIGFFVLYIALKSELIRGFELSSVVEAAREKIMYLLPVSGFVTLFVEGMISSEFVKTGVGIGAALIFTLFYYVVLSKVKGDFYEDVLTATEVSFSAITAAKEGKAAEAAPKNIQVGKTGLSEGWGASVIREKHKTENRRSRVFILDKASLLVVVILAVYSFIIPSVPGIFVAGVYTLTLTVAMGRWAKELNYPYIYLIPEKPFKKLVNLIAEQIPSIVAESVICFIPVHFILELDVALTASMAVARIGFGFIFMGVNLILQRLFSRSDKNLVSVMAYMLLSVAFSLPAAVVAFVTLFMVPFNPEVAFFATVPVNIGVSAVILFSMRNILQYSEYNYK